MPEFELSVSNDDGRSMEHVTATLARRFPEIHVVGRYRGEQQADELWLCRAPSVAHVERWVAEEALYVTRIRRLAEP